MKNLITLFFIYLFLGEELIFLLFFSFISFTLRNILITCEWLWRIAISFSFSFICFLYFFSRTHHSFFSNSIDKLKSKKRLISQELVCSCFAMAKQQALNWTLQRNLQSEVYPNPQWYPDVFMWLFQWSQHSNTPPMCWLTIFDFKVCY